MTPEHGRPILALILFCSSLPSNTLLSGQTTIQLKGMKVSETKEGSILEVLVKPRCEAFRIIVEGDDITVFCTEEPSKGKANREIIKEFSRLFHRKVELVSGFSSKQKKLLIRDVRKSEVERALLDQKF